MSNDEFPAFSVLMSVYKKEKPAFLDKALKSIEDQTVQPNQVLLVADGPLTESLNSVIEDHRKKFPEKYDILKLPHNRGLGFALQKGVENCCYDWIARMDTDDISVNNRFELQLKAIEEEPDLAIVGGQIDEFSGNLDSIVGKRNVPFSNEEIRKFIKWRNPFNHPTVMINKNAVLQVGNYQANGKIEDYFLWSKLVIANYKVKNLPEILVHMRVDAGMYKRRGDLQNIKQIFRLRKSLRKANFINFREQYLGDTIMVINTLVPPKLREYVSRFVKLS